MYKRILIPLDHSPSDTTILAHIRSLARMTSAQLILIHVADGFGARYQEQFNLEDSAEIKEDRDYLKSVEKELREEGFDVRSYLAAGEPAEQILAVAEKEACDLIAMATHGHKFVKDLILGSVADNIRHRTSLPILMIRTVGVKN